jgi:hypothetical protein
VATSGYLAGLFCHSDSPETASWKEYLVEGRSNRVTVRVGHQSATVSCGPICQRPRARDATTHAGVTIRPTREGKAVGVDHRDEEGECEDHYDGNDQGYVLSSHASEGTLTRCKVLLMRTTWRPGQEERVGRDSNLGPDLHTKLLGPRGPPLARVEYISLVF